MRAVLSVFNKTGLMPLAKGLEKLGFELFSTGGTMKEISQAGGVGKKRFPNHRLPRDP